MNKTCILSFFVVIRQTSTAANKNKCEWAVRQSTAHPHFFCRALYLQPSNNKLACPGNAHLRSVNSTFSGFASLKLHLFIHSLRLAKLLFSQPLDEVLRLCWLSHLKLWVCHLRNILDILASLELSTYRLEGVDCVLHILHCMCCSWYYAKNNLALRDNRIDYD